MNHFKGMKKVHEDKDKAVFQNKSGHEVRVAKKNLSSDMLKKLSNLPLHSADGNYVSEPEEFEPGIDYKDAPLPGEAGVSYSPAPEQPKLSPVQERYNTELLKMGRGNLQIKPGETPSDVDPTSLRAAQNYIGSQDAEKRRAEANALAKEKEQQKNFAALGLTPPAKQSVPESSTPEAPSQAAQPNHVQGSQSQQQAAAAPKQPESPEQYFQELTQETNNFAADLSNGTINPKTMQDLYASKDTMGKIGTLFGLMVSGIGSGLSGQSNAVLDMMKSEIQNDLDAQKETAKNKQNLYKLNFERELAKANTLYAGANTQLAYAQADLAATAATKNQMALTMMQQLMQQGGMLPEGEQKKRFLQGMSTIAPATDQFVQGNNAEASEAAFRARQMMYSFIPEMAGTAEFERSTHVPGVGDASIPVPQNVREEMVSHKKLENAATDLLEYSKNHLNVIPGTPEYRVGEQKAMVLQQMIRDGLLGTVYRPGEQPLLDKFVSENPAGAFSIISTQPKLRALIQSNAMASNATKEAYGLPTKAAGGSGKKKFYRGGWYTEAEYKAKFGKKGR